MNFFALLVVAFLRVTLAASSLSRRDGFLSPQDTLSTITWTLPIVEGGENYEFSGTVEEVVAQVNSKRAELGIEPLHDSYNDTEIPDDSAVHKRSYIGTECKKGRGGPADDQRILQGISYLSKLKTTCKNGAGPGNCGRISCSWNSAIYWCNDKTTDSEVYDCSMFASYAQHVYDSCEYKLGKNNRLVWGQTLDTDAFRVLVGGDSC
ncbi:hypothetical protein GGR57DRAFT_511048 [Xylariaceae sp. FL1272]|nr:hypothetical protein GGR57DRAFT_511048 [Xylariaceae sp. FL1272]